METKTFSTINPIEFIISTYLSNGRTPGIFRKHAEVTAVQGHIGETVKTILKNGMTETVNIVTIDSETGMPGWIVTGIGGEKYIIEDSDFKNRYEPVTDKENTYKSKATPVCAFRVDDDVKFIAPWGEEMKLEKDGYLICNENGDIWGVAKDEFEATYTEETENNKLYNYFSENPDKTLMNPSELKDYFGFYEFLMRTDTKGSLKMLTDDITIVIARLMTLHLEFLSTAEDNLKKTLVQELKKQNFNPADLADTAD